MSTASVTRNIVQRVALLVAIPAVFAAGYVVGTTAPVSAAGSAGTAGTAVWVQEDEPGWDCRTMGNLVCGEGATVAGVVVPAGDYRHGDQVAGPVGGCLAGLGYMAGPVVREHAEWCADSPA